MTDSNWHLGIDAGGTFTDVMAIAENGAIQVMKVPSTPEQPVRGPINGIETLLETVDASNIASVSHGTTVGLNALLQRKFPPVGLIMTRGFRHILEIARHTVPGEWGTLYRWEKPPRVVPLSHVHEVDERVDKDGNVIAELDIESVHNAAKALKAQGVRTVAVCLIHAYRFADHEQKIREILREHDSDWFISISSDVMPEFREYERTATTATNAVLSPLVGQYFNEFGQEVAKTVSDAASVYIMRSAGGVVRPAEAAAMPLRTALSGPAGGVIGAGRLASEAGFKNAITFDMGGTSTDVSAVVNGEPHLTTDSNIADYPIKSPTIDMVTIGAGGGSLITIGKGKRIQVGPQSAGAVPGPACYGKGGTQPAVTDANLVLGRIPTKLVGGDFELNKDMAHDALARLAEQADMDALSLAFTAHEIVCNNMAGAVRQVSVKRGLDPRDFTLVAFGGAGPVQAARTAELLGIPRVMVPQHPGLGSCVGLIASDIRLDRSRTFITDENDMDAALFEDGFQQLEAELKEVLAGYADVPVKFERSVDMRYRGMGTELNTPAPDNILSGDWSDRMMRTYHDLHKSIFDFSYEGDHIVQTIAIRVTAVGGRNVTVPGYDFANVHADPQPIAERSSIFALAGTPVAVPVYDRTTLPQGWHAQGPLFIDQYDTTTVVLPNQSICVDPLGNLVIEIENAGADLS